MKNSKFSELDDVQLTSAAADSRLGLERAHALVALVDRALETPSLLSGALKAIAIDRRIGFHKGAPIGWLGADRIFLSGNRTAIGALLEDMDSWDSSEQEDLVRHWAGKRGLNELTSELVESYSWVPRYQ